MKRILIEDDHYLKITAVILDPETNVEHTNAVADFVAHDVDFDAWCKALRAQIPELYPARVELAGTQADFDAKLRDVDAAVVESLAVTRDALARTERLRVVQKFGAIPTGIDLAACVDKNVRVLTLRRSGNVAVAEQAFALLVALSKRICEFNGVVTADDLAKAGYPIRPYDRRHIGGSNYARVPGLRSLAGSTLGIVGLGEIGREIAVRANAFEMSLLYHQRSRLGPADELRFGAKYVPLLELMANSDYIVVQLPLNDSTRGIIDKRAFEALKPGAILVNAARAQLMDREALLDALNSGRLAGLGMDVHYTEPVEPDDPLLSYKGGNVILMPHLAVGHRNIGLDDMRRLCVNLWRATLPPHRLHEKPPLR